jgi:Holliday junction resolvasome RuvABC DNA-binding subunit
MTKTSGRICTRCAEPLRDAERGCVFCHEERREDAIKKLAAAAKFHDSAANLARAEAISTLRNLGYPTDQITKARAYALDGYSVERVLEVLAGEGSEVVAA